MIIIIQGCDKTGKTFLAKRLASHYNLQYIHVGKPKTDDVQQQYIDLIKDRDNIVIDRLHLGQNVYGPLYRGTQIKNFQRLQNILKNRLCICVLAYNTAQHLRQLFIKQNEDFAKVQDIQLILDMFKQQSYQSKLCWYLYKKDVNLRCLISVIDNEIKADENARNSLRNNRL